MLAVFDTTKRVNGRLAQTAFKGADLHRGKVSLCRLKYTTRQTFDNQVVAPRPVTDPLLGVVVCATDVLRDLHIPIPNTAPPTQIRAACVLDKVENGDHDGHAALQYCENEEQIKGAKTKDRVRGAIALALADAFGDIRPVDSITFASAPAN